MQVVVVVEYVFTYHLYTFISTIINWELHLLHRRVSFECKTRYPGVINVTTGVYYLLLRVLVDVRQQYEVYVCNRKGTALQKGGVFTGVM